MNEKTLKSPVCLTVAGLDPSGGAGIAADIKTFAAFGCYAASAVTSVTYQNTQGVFGAEHQSAESVRRQMEPVFDDFDVSAVKTGMLPTSEIISEIAAVLSGRAVEHIVVDPVVRSTSGFDLIDDEALQCLKKTLFSFASVLTPNLVEAERISGIKIRGETDFEKAADAMLACGAGSVLITGGHGADTEPRIATDRLYTPGGMFIFKSKYIETKSTHGTGCTLSSAIAARLAHGDRLEDAVSAAKNYVTEAIATAEGLGKGHSPVNHWAGVKILGDK